MQMPDGNTRRDRFANEARDDVTTFYICEQSEAICPLSVILSVSEESYRSNGKILHFVQDDNSQRDRFAKEARDDVPLTPPTVTKPFTSKPC